MISRKRILRLAAKYGPFVRFFPEGPEGSDDTDNGTPDNDVKEGDKKDEPKIEDSPEFKGLLRDRQADRASLSHVNAENVAFKQENERLQRELATAKKPSDELPELSEEEAGESVTRREFQKTLHKDLGALGKNLIENVTKILDERDTKNSKRNLARNQSADAQALKKTHTAKTKGQTLDATTVVNDTATYLAANHPELLEALKKQPDFASLLYKIGSGEALVPTIGQRVTLRRNTLLAQQLDNKGADVPGGSGPSGGGMDVFEAIMSGDMSDEAVDELTED